MSLITIWQENTATFRHAHLVESCQTQFKVKSIKSSLCRNNSRMDIHTKRRVIWPLSIFTNLINNVNLWKLI